MMLSKFECNDSELSNEEYFHDIEEISNALYVDRMPHDSNLISLRPNLGKKLHFCESNSMSEMGFNCEDELCKEVPRSSSSLRPNLGEGLHLYDSNSMSEMGLNGKDEWCRESSSTLRPNLGKELHFYDSKSRSKMGLNDEDEWCKESSSSLRPNVGKELHFYDLKSRSKMGLNDEDEWCKESSSSLRPNVGKELHLYDLKSRSKMGLNGNDEWCREVSKSSSLSPNLGKELHLYDLKSKSKMGLSGEDEWCKEVPKSTSIWGWKPLKALSHIRHKKFACYFFCHVHSVENLPPNFDGVCLSVHWRRKDDVLRTRSLRVSSGMVDFEETLMSKCNVYGAKSGHGNFMKYEAKHFLLYVSVVGADGFDVGKHWVDLTRLLPVRVEELEKDKCSGKWSTSFKLEGKAKDATLHVSFGFLVTKDSLAELGGNIKLPLSLNLERNELNRTSFVADCVPNEGNTSLRRAESVPSTLTNSSSSNSYQCFDAKIGWPKDISDFSNSISMLYGKLEDEVSDNSSKIDLVYERLESRDDLDEAKRDAGEFTVIEDRIESESTSEEVNLLYDSTVEVIDVAEFFKEDGISSDEDTMSSEKEASDSLGHDLLIDKHSILDIEGLPELEPSENTFSGDFTGSYEDKGDLLDIQESPKLESLEDLTSGEFKVSYKDKEDLLDIQESPKLESSEDLTSGEFKVSYKDKEDLLDIQESPKLESSEDLTSGEFEVNYKDKEDLLDIQESPKLESSEDLTSGEFKVNYKDKEDLLDIQESPKLESSEDLTSGGFKVNYNDKDGLPGILESPKLESSEDLTSEDGLLDIQEFLNLELSEDFMSGEFKVKHKGSKLIRSLSLDDVSKAVVEDFCNMWQDGTPSTPSSNTSMESPRGRLLRQFEEDMMACETFFLRNNALDEDNYSESGSNQATQSISFTDYTFDGIDLSPIITNDSNRSVNQAKTLERLETQTLMERWGLNEDVFLSSSDYSAGGFGSPIFVPSDQLEDSLELPPLGEGLESLLKLSNGGVLRSMNPLLFKNMKNCGSLIMQASKLVVLPAELGLDIMELLQGMASAGSQQLSEKLLSLLPLDELSGQIMQQLAWGASYEPEPEPEPNTHPRQSSTHHESDVKIKIETSDYNSVNLSSQVNDTMSDHITTRDISAFVLDTIEALTIEGLKVQSNMSDENPPSSIRVKSSDEPSSQHAIGNCGLLDHSISLDEWLQLDNAGMVDNIIVGLMIQLRDPLRNYEPVGTPMLGLIQMEKISNSSELNNGDITTVPTFRLKEVHIAGLNLESDHTESWATKQQQQSGSRWLLASGLIQKPDSHFPTSMSLVRFSTQVFKKPWTGCFLWSMSRPIQAAGIKTQFSPWNVHTRNPDLLFM